MRQVFIVGIAAESELEDLHPREAHFVAQGNDVGGDQAQVFRDHGQIAECLPDGEEEVAAWALDPGAVDSGRLARRDRPVSLEARK